MSTDSGDKKKYFRAGFAGLLAGCLWFSASAAAWAQENPAQTPAQQGTRTDADIQSDVGYALTHDPTLRGQQIASTTAQGTVTLSGTVQTNAQRQQAETIAANVQGVSGILNNIKVANPGSASNSGSVSSGATANQAAQSSQGAAQSEVPPPPPDEPPPPPDMDTQGNPDQNANGAYGQQAPPSVQQAPPPEYSGARPVYPAQPQYPAQQYPPQQQYPQQQYPQQQYPQQQYPPQQQAYAPPPSGPVTIPAGTLLRVRLSEPLDTARLKSGAIFQATSAADIYLGGALAIPRGAVLQGQVVESKNAGALGGSAELQLALVDVNLEGAVFPLETDTWSSKGPNKAGYTAGNTVGGAAIGAIIGGIIGHGAGAAIGAGVGGAGGLAASSATSGPRLILPAEAQVDFHLTNPVTVQPVSWQEAQRLASSAPQQPRLVQRPIYPRPYPYAYPYPYTYPYPYAYPYPYYYGRVY